MDYIITEARPDDNDKIAALDAQLMGAGRRLCRRYLEWKYHENPFIESPLFFVVRLDDEIVAIRGMYGTCWNLGPGREHEVLPHADDLIIHPDHRNKGLFLRMHQAMVGAAGARGYQAILNLTGGTATQELSLVCGYQALGELERTYQPVVSGFPLLRRAEGRAVRALRQRGLSSPAFAWGVSVNGLCRRIASSANSQVEVTSRADFPEMSALSESQASGSLRALRTEAFLRWRLRNPDRVYRFVYWRDSRLRGYVVLAWDWIHPHRVMIADYAADDDAVLCELFRIVGAPADTECVMLATTQSDSHQQMARTAGFHTAPEAFGDERRRFLYYPLTPSGSLAAPDGETDAFPSGWRLSLLDTMAS